MCIGMTPGRQHSYYLTQVQRIIELSWPARRKRTTSCKEALLRLLHGGPRPGTHETVDPEKFRSAVHGLEKQDVELAISEFTKLGYEVTVRTAP